MRMRTVGTAPPRRPRAPSSSPSLKAASPSQGVRCPRRPRFTDAPAAMLPAALLRRPGLRRLLLQARTYAEAAAAPAPAAGPGQMSFTFASPTQVRTRGPRGRQDPDLTCGGWRIHLFWVSSSNPTGTLSAGLAPSVGSPRARPVFTETSGPTPKGVDPRLHPVCWWGRGHLYLEPRFCPLS